MRQPTSQDIKLSGRQLFLNGEPVVIGARAFDVLSLLMKHRDRVVTKNELLESAWSGLVVEDNNLPVQISTLRKLLGPNTITTVPGQGYQFTPASGGDVGIPPGAEENRASAPHEAQNGKVGATTSAPTGQGLVGSPVPARGSWMQHPRAIIATVLTLLLVGGYAAFHFLRPVAPTAAAPAAVAAPPASFADHSIAVLPFVDISEKNDLEYFSNGLYEEVMDQLSRMPELHVAPRTSAFSFKGKSVDLPTIARQLKVANILEGSVRRSGNELRIRTQLVRADNGYQLWSQTYDRQIGNIFQIQDEIAASVAQALRRSLLDEGSPKPTSSKSMEAYVLYLQARSLEFRAGTQADWEQVDEYARHAISADVTFAPSWALFSRVLSTRTRLGFVSDSTGWDAARQTAQRSLALEPGLPEGHTAMASVLMRHDWDWEAAQAHVDQALQQDPANAMALNAAGSLALVQGNAERAVAFYESAVANDPLDPNQYLQLARALYFKGRFTDARASVQKALALDSRQPFAHWSLARIAIASGDPSAALAELSREPNEEVRLEGEALAFHKQGRTADSDVALAELEKRFADHNAADIAAVHAFRGSTEQAFAWLERAYQQREADLIFIKLEPLLQPLRSDHRYEALLRKMKLYA